MTKRTDVYRAQLAEELNGQWVAVPGTDPASGAEIAGLLDGWDLVALDLEPAERRRLGRLGWDAIVVGFRAGRARHYALQTRPR